jgi:hypothetical protein
MLLRVLSSFVIAVLTQQVLEKPQQVALEAVLLAVGEWQPNCFRSVDVEQRFERHTAFLFGYGYQMLQQYSHGNVILSRCGDPPYGSVQIASRAKSAAEWIDTDTVGRSDCSNGSVRLSVNRFVVLMSI